MPEVDQATISAEPGSVEFENGPAHPASQIWKIPNSVSAMWWR